MSAAGGGQQAALAAGMGDAVPMVCDAPPEAAEQRASEQGEGQQQQEQQQQQQQEQQQQQQQQQQHRQQQQQHFRDLELCCHLTLLQQLLPRPDWPSGSGAGGAAAQGQGGGQSQQPQHHSPTAAETDALIAALRDFSAFARAAGPPLAPLAPATAADGSGASVAGVRSVGGGAVHSEQAARLLRSVQAALALELAACIRQRDQQQQQHQPKAKASARAGAAGAGPGASAATSGSAPGSAGGGASGPVSAPPGVAGGGLAMRSQTAAGRLNVRLGRSRTLLAEAAVALLAAQALDPASALPGGARAALGLVDSLLALACPGLESAAAPEAVALLEACFARLIGAQRQLRGACASGGGRGRGSPAAQHDSAGGAVPGWPHGPRARARLARRIGGATAQLLWWLHSIDLPWRDEALGARRAGDGACPVGAASADPVGAAGPGGQLGPGVAPPGAAEAGAAGTAASQGRRPRAERAGQLALAPRPIERSPLGDARDARHLDALLAVWEAVSPADGRDGFGPLGPDGWAAPRSARRKPRHAGSGAEGPSEAAHRGQDGALSGSTTSESSSDDSGPETDGGDSGNEDGVAAASGGARSGGEDEDEEQEELCCELEPLLRGLLAAIGPPPEAVAQRGRALVTAVLGGCDERFGAVVDRARGNDSGSALPSGRPAENDGPEQMPEQRQCDEPSGSGTTSSRAASAATSVGTVPAHSEGAMDAAPTALADAAAAQEQGKDGEALRLREREDLRVAADAGAMAPLLRCAAARALLRGAGGLG
jgi:hypothetical protein